MVGSPRRVDEASSPQRRGLIPFWRKERFMARAAAFVVLGLSSLMMPLAADACSLCAVAIRRDTLGQELERAKIVLYGYALNPKDNLATGATPGTGTTELHIEKVVKRDPFLGDAKSITLNRLLPVPDPKKPPYYLVFCDVFQGKLDPYHGRSLTSPKILEYVEQAQPHRAKGHASALLYYAKFLDSADPTIADDAFLEFAKSNDQEVGEAAKSLDPERLRGLLKDAQGDAERASLFAFMLGAAGGPKEAEVLRGLIERPTPELRKALDGLFCGYITLRPRQGWDAALALAADPKQDFPSRFAVLRACRFQYNWKPKESRPELLRIYKAVLADPEMADLAIDDLRRWQIWDFTTDILALFDKKSHDAPITKRTIARYALCSPQAEAKDFVQRLRQIDRELVNDLEETLMFEKGK
jgi:hypothetical protein